ncbi:hypothetical protein [Flavobacterium sp. WG21]|uniref:hypothetical protein n=1 Tax=Flavobacterium sp. WG21 TaxID=1229487 RepID=UPI0003462853|nr:hypothetical protein [Flavobacterium sp. WG21]
MKKITLALLLLSSFTFLFAQAPQKMSYQSVIRKTDGTLVAGTLVSIKTSILAGSTTGTASYVETQTTTTNSNGLATIEIGGGTPVTGTFSGINWGAGSHFIKTEIDPKGGNNYTISGTSQLLSVPYALYAGNSQSKGKTSIFIAGDITDAEAAAKVKADFGPETENVYVVGTTNLTTLDLSAVEKVIDLKINDNLKLVSIDFGNLIEINNSIYIYNNPKLTSLSFPALKAIRGGSDFEIMGNESLASLSFPVLTKMKLLYANYNPVLSSVDLSSLVSLADGFGSLQFRGCALSSSQVNSLLSKLLNVLPASKKRIELSEQNPPAPPTGQGLINKAALINAGNSVTTD